MKLTNFSMMNMINTLEVFAGKKLPQKISYAITKNLIILHNDLQNDYDCYIKSINKLFSEYDDYMVRDANHDIVYNNAGIPMVNGEAEKEFNNELSELLNIEIDTEVTLYHIPENVFDYEDNTNRYDSLSAADIMNLQSILCNRGKSDKNEA